MVSIKRQFAYLIAVLACWLLPYVAQAAVSAQWDRNPVGIGETVTLTFTSEGIANKSPDLSVLEKDFDVQGSSQSNSVQIVNGKTSVRTVWALELAPRHTGTLTVPPIAFGAEQSAALTLQVLDQPNNPAANGADDVLVELSFEPQQPYVQQQVIVTQRLLHTVALQPQASLTHPAIVAGKGSILALGDPRNTTQMRNGRNYNVIERRYALMPQQSGELRLGATTFEGMVVDRSMRQYDPFGITTGKPVKRTSSPLTLNVKAQPTTYQGKQWLPANSVSINAHWQTPPDKLKAGEPATLTLAIMADGLTAEQLPKLELQVPANIKAYADKADLRNETNANGVIGVRQENWVVVPHYNGTYHIPALTLDWWNLKTGKAEVATLDAMTLNVTGGQAAPKPNANPTTPKPQANAPAPNATALEAPPAPQTQTGVSWAWIGAGLLAVWMFLSACWLVWRWVRNQSADTTNATAKAQRMTDAKAVWRDLEQACQQNQAQAAHYALLQWVEVGLHLQPPTIATLSEQGGAILRAELDQLNNVLYGRTGQVWSGATLLKALQHFKPATAEVVKASGLAELYPD